MKAWVTRFAPSPTGPLHLGHALAAFTAHDLARASGGRFLLRFEDIDGARCSPEFEAMIRADLAWLGLSWDGPVLRQSARMDQYRVRLDELRERGLIYPCFCTRGEIAAEIARMVAAPQGPQGALYPGTCRALSPGERTVRMAAGQGFAWRLDVAAAVATLAAPAAPATLDVQTLTFEEQGRGPAGERGVIEVEPALFGDVVLGRKDLGVSYHLAVVLDDYAQGVTLVSRGEDLFAAAHVQRLLQSLFGLPAPLYHHHRLVGDDSGRRLAKRNRDRALGALRAAGASVADVRRMLEPYGLP